jgi:hypothetical protein
MDHLLTTLYVWRHSSSVKEGLLLGYKVPSPKKAKTLQHVSVGGKWKINESSFRPFQNLRCGHEASRLNAIVEIE